MAVSARARSGCEPVRCETESLPICTSISIPICPFAWMTSKWVRLVAEQRDYTVDWRFIALRLVNENVDYDTQFPPEYRDFTPRG